jgi:hypothetical protein
MTLYDVVNYVHVVSAIGLGAVVALEWFVVVRLRATSTVEQARTWLSFTGAQQWAGPASMALLLLAGVYMAATRWGGQGWIVVGLITLLLILPLGALNGLPLRKLGQAVAQGSGQLAPEITRQLRHPRLVLSVQVRVGMVLGVVWLMVEKPDVPASIVVVLLGALSAAPALQG